MHSPARVEVPILTRKKGLPMRHPFRAACRAFRVAGVLVAFSVMLPVAAWAQTNLTAGTESALRDAIFQASNDFADNGVMNGGAYTITLTANITLTKSLPMIRGTVPGDGSTIITIAGGGFTIDANNTGRVFFVERGRVLIKNVTINNAKAVGGNGGAGPADGRSGGGGGGLGAGAAVFADDGAEVTVRSVTIGSAASQGGTGGNGTSGSGGSSGGGGGGGLGGNGSSLRRPSGIKGDCRSKPTRPRTVSGASVGIFTVGAMKGISW